MKKELRKLIKSLQGEILYLRHRPLYLRDRPRRVLFDHLPKCAGTAVTEYLVSHYPQRFVFRTDGRRVVESVKEFQSLPEDFRYRYRLITGHLANELLDYVHPETITFTIFRNPVDRIISHYYFVKQDRRHYLHDRVVQGNIQLEEYASSKVSNELRNWYTTHYTGLSIEEAEARPEESVRRAVEVISRRYGIIGFQDDLPAAMHGLRNAAHLYRDFDNLVRNKTRRRIGLEQVPEKAKKAIADVNFLDVRLYALLRARAGRNEGPA